jgi:alpha-maltose-1-phosphate synthase
MVDNPYKIALVTPYFHPFVGGAEQVAFTTAKLLVQRGHAVEVFTFKHVDNLPDVEITEGVTIRRYPYKTLKLLGFTTAQSPALIEALTPLQADAVHIHNTTYPLFLTAVAKKLKEKNLPTMLVTHGIFEAIEGEHQGFKRFLYQNLIKFLMRRLLENITMVGALSQFDLDVLKTLGLEIVSSTILYNGVNLPEDVSDPVATKDTASPLNLLHVASIKPNKGHTDVITALSSGNLDLEVIYHVVGSGGSTWQEQEKKVRRAVKQARLDNQVVFHGRVNDAERDSLYRHTDIVIVPSHAETFPLAVLEGMSYAKPVIATNVGGVRTIMDKKSGIMIEAKRPNEIVKALQQLKSAEARRVYGECGRALVANQFTWETVIDKYVAATHHLKHLRS